MKHGSSEPLAPAGPAHRPGRPRSEQVEDAIPTPAAGEVVARTIFLSIDPYMRGRLREQQTYAVAIQVGEVMTGETVGEVVASAHPDFAPGDIVVGGRGWQSHTVSRGEALVKLPRHGAPLSAYLGVLGMPGATAYAGISEICKPQKGETVVISAASGAVGSSTAISVSVRDMCMSLVERRNPPHPLP